MMKSNFIVSHIACSLLSGMIQAQPIAVTKPEDLQRLQSKVEAVSQKVLGATVALIAEKNGSSGSGIIHTADGLILTAAHVIQGSKELLVVFPDGKQVRGDVLGANYSKDIGMVKIRDKGTWPFVELGNSKQLKAGDWVVALGHSAGFDAARTPPVRFGQVISTGPAYYFTTDCTLIGGDSGGPIFDLEGKIIGINSSIGEDLSSNNHAGIDGFKEDWERLKKSEQWGSLNLNPFENPEKPVLGIGMGADFPGIPGVSVADIYPGSSAAQAGVKIGDVIQSIDGTAVKNREDLMKLITKRKAGDEVKILLYRDEQQVEVTVKLARFDQFFRQR